MWSNIITAHREELEYFFREIQSKIIRRKILLRSLELAGLPIEQKTYEKSPESEENILKKARRFLSGSLIAMLEDVKSYKYLTTINNDLSEMVNNRFPAVATRMIRNIPKMLRLLERNHYIKKGGKKRTTINKEDRWDAQKVMDFLDNNFIE